MKIQLFTFSRRRNKMFRTKNIWLVISMLVILSMVVAACAPATATPATQPTSAPVVQPTKAPVAAPTSVPATAAPTAPKAKDPNTFTYMTFGDPETLDPSVDYETAGSGILMNIYEGLVTFDGADQLQVKAQLAQAIPDPVDDGKGGVSYTWTLEDGVKFHNGDPMAAHDVAFSFWRTMLVGDNAVAPNFLD